MIAPFDQVKESVRQYEDKLKGKEGDNIGQIDQLTMGVIMDKNKKINF